MRASLVAFKLKREPRVQRKNEDFRRGSE